MNGICGRLVGWLREIGMDFADIIVKSDDDAALTSLGRESWSSWRAMKGGSRMIVDHAPRWAVTQSNENREKERFNQFRA